MRETLRIGIVQPFGAWEELEVTGGDSFGFDAEGSVIRGGASDAFSLHRGAAWMFVPAVGHARRVESASGYFHAAVGRAHVIVELAAAPPLDPIEHTLLARIGRGEREAVPVLGDHWLAGADPARGELLQLSRLAPTRRRAEERRLLALHHQRWCACAAVIDCGFAPERVVFEDGFVALPLAIVDGEPLSRGDAIFRISPRVYRGLGDSVVLAADGELGRAFVRGAHSLELELLQRCVHPNLPRLLDRIALRRGTAVALARCGACLDTLFPAGGMPLAVALALAEQLCAALEPVHALGRVHGDLRPECIYLSSDGNVTLHGFADAAVLPPADITCLEELLVELLAPRPLPARLREVLASHGPVGELREDLQRFAAGLSLQIGPHLLAGLASD